MKKSTRLLTIPIILSAVFLWLPAPVAHGSHPPRPSVQSLIECANGAFDEEYPDEAVGYYGTLTDEQLAKLTTINYNCNFNVNYIVNVDGLEKMTSLEIFGVDVLSWPTIETIDFSHNPKLKEVNLGIRLVTDENISINLSNNPKLETLSLSTYRDAAFSGSLSPLDLSNNLELKTLSLYSDIDGDGFVIDLSHNTKLENLSAYNTLVKNNNIIPKKDGNRLVYDLSSLKFLAPNPDWGSSFPIYSKCSDANDYTSCSSDHIVYDEENMLLYVDDLEAINKQVQITHCLGDGDVCDVQYRLELNEPEEDTLLSPDTGSFTENLGAANMTFPAIGIVLGALAAGLLSYKKIKIKE